MKSSVSEVLSAGRRYLEKYGIEDAFESSEQLLSHALGEEKYSLYLGFESTLAEEKKSRFFELLKQRAERYPIQYLIGSVPFRAVGLKVEAGVFIPRPETEGLVDVVLSRICESEIANPAIIDVGTGTGAIAVSLAFEIPKATIVATDQSSISVRLAGQNAARNGVCERIKLIETNYWDGILERFDCLVSNPPYLTKKELTELQPEIDFEPKKALDGGEDGFQSYRFMIESAQSILKPAGIVCFEVGFGQAGRVEDLFKKNGFCDIQKTKDLAGIERIVSACLAG